MKVLAQGARSLRHCTEQTICGKSVRILVKTKGRQKEDARKTRR